MNTIGKHNKYGNPEFFNRKRQLFELSKQVALILVKRILEDRSLDELLERDPAEDRHSDRCLERKAQEVGEVASYVATGILNGLEDPNRFPLDSIYGD